MTVLKLIYGSNIFLHIIILLFNGVNSATTNIRTEPKVSATITNGTILTSTSKSITVSTPTAKSTLTAGLTSTVFATGNPNSTLNSISSKKTSNSTTSKSSTANLTSTYNSTIQSTNSPPVNLTINPSSTATIIPSQTKIPTSSSTATIMPSSTEIPTSSSTAIMPSPTKILTSSSIATIMPSSTQIPTSSSTATIMPSPTKIPTSSSAATIMSSPTRIPTSNSNSKIMSSSIEIQTSSSTTTIMPLPTEIPTLRSTATIISSPTKIPTSTSTAKVFSSTKTPTSSSTSKIMSSSTEIPTSSATAKIMTSSTEIPTSSTTATIMQTSTQFPTSSSTATIMSSPTKIPTSSSTSKIMSSSIEIQTSSSTATIMPSSTQTPTSSSTAALMSSSTESPTSSSTATIMASSIQIPTSSSTATIMASPTKIPTSSSTATLMPSSTESPSSSSTATIMPSSTLIPTSSLTATIMPSQTKIPSSSSTATLLPSSTESPTSSSIATIMQSSTEIPTLSSTATIMSSSTKIPSSSSTATLMPSSTESPTSSLIATIMPSPIKIQVSSSTATTVLSSTDSLTSSIIRTIMSTSTTDLTLNSTTASFNSSISRIGMNTTDEYINMTIVEPSTREESTTLHSSSTQINKTLNETQTTETTIITTYYQTTMTENNTTSNKPSTTSTNVIVTRTSTAAVPTTEKPLGHMGGPHPTYPFRDGEYSYYEIQVVASKNQTVDFVWYLNEHIVNEGQSFSRIHSIDFRNETRFISKLVFNPILHNRDNGGLIRYKINSYLYPPNGTLPVEVIPQPSIHVNPRSPSIEKDSFINVTCNYTNFVAINASDSIQWLLDGSSYNVEGHTITEAGWIANVITVSTGGNYTCRPSEHCASCANYSIVSVYEKEITPCPSSTNGQWPTTAPGSIQLRPCPEGFIGEMSRECEKKADGSGRWKPENKFKCIRKDIQEIFETIEDIKRENVTHVLESSLDKINTATTNSSGLSSGDLYKTVDVLDKIISIGNLTNTTVDEKVFGDIIGNLISDSADNKKNWDEVNQESKSGGASRILKTVTTFGEVLGKKLEPGQHTNITNDNMVLQVEKSKPKLIDFKPEGRSRLEFPKGNFEEQDKDILIITAFYDKIGAILPNSGQNNGSVVASPVMSLSIDGFENKTLKWPLTLTLSNQDVNFTQPKTDCVFWDFRNHEWNSYGCTYNQLKSKNNISVCECTHLTNFAILMSQGDETISEEDMKRLQIISDIGCSISILGLILTMIVYARVWRHVKNERSILLMNLCTALTIAYILFISAVDRDVEEIPCTIITACLHYIFLVVFFIMLAEGIDILIAVVIVFRKSSKMKFLLVMSWGVPLIIVGITLGLTRDKEYFTPHYCWLTIKDGVLFAFVGPVFFVILANIIIIIITLRALFSTHSMKSKQRKEKAISGIRSICTLLPILGITWLFGLLTVNDDSVIFQYLFAVTNSLQGFLIFIFHCVLNRAVQKAMRHIIQRHDLYQSRTKESFLKLQRTKSSESYDTQDKNNEKVSQRKYSDNGSMMNSFQMSSIPFPRTKSSESYDTPDKNNEKVLQRQYSDNGSRMALFQMPRISLPRKESWSYS